MRRAARPPDRARQPFSAWCCPDEHTLRLALPDRQPRRCPVQGQTDVPQTILIVEDETTIAEVLADNLQDEGYHTLVAADGASGLRFWQNETPNLVILDVMLPQLSGFEVCRTMRARGDATPVLFLSAKGQVEDRVQGLRAGGGRLSAQALSSTRVFAAGRKHAPAAELE